MSLFGSKTFRRVKVKKHSFDQSEAQLEINSSAGMRNSGVFNSTPNLYKIDQNIGKKKTPVMNPLTELDKNSTSGSVVSFKWNFDNRRSNSTTETWTGGGDGGSSSKGIGDKVSSDGSTLRRFASMMSFIGTLKRTKSTKKLGLGSNSNIAKESTTKETSGGGSIKTSIIKDYNSSTLSNTNSLPRSRSKGKLKQSPFKSEAYLKDLNDQEEDLSTNASESERSSLNSASASLSNLKISSSSNQGYGLNNEPGVLSSGSSSENSSVHDIQSIRASSEKSDIMEESEEEYLDKYVKDPAEIERQKTVLLGVKKFNMDSKKGIEFLVDKGILEYTSDDVARFIKDGVGLSKAAIGNYLGERIDFNEIVLKAFVDLHDFKDLIVVEALRQFLWSFRLPGESQKISRMLDAFADRYCQLNQGLFSTDTCSVLCYSIIMLNTELHNPNVKEKVTVEQFIKRNQGIEGGNLLSSASMIKMYNSILTEPFRFPEEDGNDLMLTFFNPDIEGWLHKYGGRPKSWKRLWFILSNNCLYYFKFTTDKTPKGIIPLENILVRIPQDKPGKLFSLILYKDSPDPRMVDYIKTCKTLPDGQTVPKLYSSIQLGTSNKKERDRWVRSINANHSMSRFYSDLTLKKMKKVDKSKDKAKFQSNDRGRKGVRKSQISLPASVLGTDAIPEAVLLNPTKDPKNFFIQKNLSSISLANNLSIEEDLRLRSKSESRLNDYYPKSISPSISKLSRTDSSFNNVRETDFDCTLKPSERGESIQYFTETVSKVSEVTSPINLVIKTTETSKSKLSMIMEQFHSEKALRSINSSPPHEQVELDKNETFLSDISCTISASNYAETEQSQATEVTEGEEFTIESFIKERQTIIDNLSCEEDCISICSSIEVINYSDSPPNHNVQLLNYRLSKDKDLNQSEQNVSTYVPEIVLFRNIYESNV